MAGRVVVSTLNNDTGVLATQNGMTGIAKAWVNFNGNGTNTIRSSFNVSSITRNSSGDYTVNFTTALPNADYAPMGVGSNATGDGTCMVQSTTAPTTTAWRTLCKVFGSTQVDAQYIYIAILGN
jgi:hypothetical protein